MHLTNFEIKLDKKLRKLKSTDFPKCETLTGGNAQRVVYVCTHICLYIGIHTQITNVKLKMT